MALHASAAMMVRVLTDSGLTFGPDATPESRRAAMIAATANPLFPKHPVHDVADRAIHGPAGEIPVRVFRPSAATGLPLLLWFHGGGWVTGNLDTHDQLGRLLCDAVGAVVVSVDYRLAPEARLRNAKVPTDVVRADGLIHGFFGMHEFMLPGRDAWDVSIAALRAALAPEAT